MVKRITAAMAIQLRIGRPSKSVRGTDLKLSDISWLFTHFPSWLQKAALCLGCLAAAAILSVMAWRTGLDAVRAFRVGEVVMGGREVIVWPARMVLPLGFGLAAFASLLRAGLVLRGYPVTQSERDGDAS